MITVSKEDYLKAILEAEGEGEQVISARLAQWLSVSAPAVTMALRRLKRDGLVSVRSDGLVQLTTEGRKIARRLPQLPYHRVFATTAAEDEDFHGTRFRTTCLLTRMRCEAKEKSRAQCARCQTCSAAASPSVILSEPAAAGESKDPYSRRIAVSPSRPVTNLGLPCNPLLTVVN